MAAGIFLPFPERCGKLAGISFYNPPLVRTDLLMINNIMLVRRLGSIALSMEPYENRIQIPHSNWAKACHLSLAFSMR